MKNRVKPEDFEGVLERLKKLEGAVRDNCQLFNQGQPTKSQDSGGGGAVQSQASVGPIFDLQDGWFRRIVLNLEDRMITMERKFDQNQMGS